MLPLLVCCAAGVLWPAAAVQLGTQPASRSSSLSAASSDADQSRIAIRRAVATLQSEDRLAALDSHGAWVRSSRKQEAQFALDRNESDQSRHKYGFYLHTFSKPIATINLLRTLRKTYPDEPVYVMSDGGMMFDGICKEIGNCNFQWRPPANDRWNPLPFFNRFREAARWLGTKYVVMLEPDNEVVDRIKFDPPEDAGGLRDTNPAFGKRIRDYVTELGRTASGNEHFELKWWRFGFCGGSYFRTAAVLDAFDPATIDWHALRSFDNHRIWSSDLAMPMALAIHGYSYQPWEELTQKRTENWYGNPTHVAFKHHGKDEGMAKYFEEPLSKEDLAKRLYEVKKKGTVGQVACQGCVWVSDEVCWKQPAPVACPITGHDMGPP